MALSEMNYIRENGISIDWLNPSEAVSKGRETTLTITNDHKLALILLVDNTASRVVLTYNGNTVTPTIERNVSYSSSAYAEIDIIEDVKAGDILYSKSAYTVNFYD